ncbi:MAG TPA: hypothetical protein VK960_05350 [Acidimicrobiia bacterium]|nr:hypothetical protein [Acidimicrobiia bacterium]
MTAQCSGRPYDLVRPFVGAWNEYSVANGEEVLLGTLESSLAQDGCVFTQSFSSADGNLSFMTFGFVDETNQWIETYVFNDGRAASYRWREEADEIITERIGGSASDMRRLRIRFVTTDLYEVSEERSLDRGKTWEFVELVRTRRVAS